MRLLSLVLVLLAGCSAAPPAPPAPEPAAADDLAAAPDLQPPAPPLVVTLTVTGPGEVSSEPPGLRCPGTCSATFPAHTPVRLRPAPGRRARLGAWEGPCALDSGSGCPLTLRTGAASVSARFEDKSCAPSGWCVDQELPGLTVRAIYGFGPDDIWISGAPARFHHFDGGGWSAPWLDVRWPASAPPQLNALWGPAPGDLWAAGYTGGLLPHFDGRLWSPVSTVILGSQWCFAATSARDVWMGGLGAVAHYDGERWQSTSVPGLYKMYALWAPGDRGLWGGGLEGIWRYDGTSWSLAEPRAKGINAMWGAGARDAWAVGQGLWRFDGTAWTEVLRPDPTVTLTAVWGSGPDDVFVVGYQGRVLHFDGAAWSAMESGTTASLFGVWGSGRGRVYAVGSSLILRYEP